MLELFAAGTADVVAAAKAARQTDLPVLEIPENYYDDLEARFGLDGELADRMRSLNILYDRDDQAEYYQFCSRAFAKRVFVEVVQRKDYDAIGATNALIRLAAQARFKGEEGAVK